MSAKELDALIEQTVRDPRVPARARGIIERVFRERDLDDDARTAFVAQAIVLARGAVEQPHLRQTLAWLHRLAAMVDGAPAARPSADAHPPKGEASEAYFSPGNDCLDAILRAFEGARERVDVCVFTITDDRIRDAMLRAKRRGVALRVITDNDKALDEGSDVKALERAGVAVRIDLTEAHMHHKFALFDARRILTGSYNWTRSAANFNAENVLVTADPTLVRAFSDAFEALWARYEARAAR